MLKKFLPLLLLLVIPLAAAEVLPSTLCITPDGCAVGALQLRQECTQLNAQYSPPLTVVSEFSSIDEAWYPAGTEIPDPIYAVCEEGCCIRNGLGQQMQEVECSYLAATQTGETITYQAGACPDEISQDCGNSESECYCAGRYITQADSQICCYNQIVDGSPGDSCGLAPTTPTQNTQCGDGFRQGTELCDVKAYVDSGGNDIGICAESSVEGVEQRCTANCRCGVIDDDYNVPDGLCGPGDNDPDCQEEPCVAQLIQPVADVTQEIGVQEVIIDWDIQEDPACTATLNEFELSWTYTGETGGGSGGISTLGDAREQIITIFPEKTYTVEIIAVYDTGRADPVEVDFTTGPWGCYENSLGVYCSSEDENEVGTHRTVCEIQTEPENVMITRFEDCRSVMSGDPNARCYPSEEGAACLGGVDCAECNAGYDTFGEIRGDTEIEVTRERQGGGIETITRECQDLDTLTLVNIPGGDTAAVCILDFSQSALMEYRGCNEYNSCAQYGSQSTCENDLCRVQGDCTWDDTIGMGLCYNTNEDLQDCSQYDEDVCSSIPGCLQGTGECKPASQAYCEDFTTAETCVVGSDANDPGENYDMDPITHEAIAVSKNAQNLPKCKWINPPNDPAECIKDSDDDGTKETESSDFTNPITTLRTSSGQVYPPNQEFSIPFTRNEEGVTFIAILETEGACGEGENTVANAKANNRFIGQDPSVTEITLEKDEGAWCIFYYSRDNNRNLEVVKNATITVGVSATAEIVINSWHETFDNIQGNVGDARVYWDTGGVDAVCSGALNGQSGYPTVVEQVGTEFTSGQLTELDPGIYTYTISCRRPGAPPSTAVTKDEQIAITIDDRIQDPIPPLQSTGYEPEEVAYIGIHTEYAVANTGDCQYQDGGQWLDLPTQRNRGGNRMLHQLSPAPNTNTGFYNYPVRCEFDGAWVLGEPGDAIRFGINVDGPPPIDDSLAFTGMSYTLTESGGMYNAEVVWSTDKEATCNGLMINDAFEPIVTGATGTSFSSGQFSDLPESVWVYEVTCTRNNVPPISQRVSFTVDKDPRIFRPIPEYDPDGYTPDEVDTVGIHTNITGLGLQNTPICYYEYNNQWTQLFPAEIRPGVHRHTGTPPTVAEGLWELPVRCEFDGETVDGGPADTIRYLIGENVVYPGILRYLNVWHTEASNPEAGTADVTINWVMDREALCRAEMQSGASGVGRLTPNLGTQFTSGLIRDLQDGLYNYRILCSTQQVAELEENYAFTLDTDQRISNPFPPYDADGYRPDDYTNISIDTKVSGSASFVPTCTYEFEGEQRQMAASPLENDGEHRHTANIPSTETGFYNMSVQCDFGGEIVFGGPADNIVYGIDASGPTLEILDEDEEAVEAQIEIPEPISATIYCEDPEIAGNENNFASGCLRVEIRIDDTEEWNTLTSSDEYPFTIDPETIYQFRAVDRNDNVGPEIFVAAAIKDITGPERPDFSVIS